VWYSLETSFIRTADVTKFSVYLVGISRKTECVCGVVAAVTVAPWPKFFNKNRNVQWLLKAKRK